ncbi:hypothetical protein BO82DRAFT_278742, partial [Aspergillus uvarum CBS 121591]
TAVASSGILFLEEGSRFSLQPLDTVSLHKFNKILDKYYKSSATCTEVRVWMDANEQYKAFADSASEDWMQDGT